MRIRQVSSSHFTPILKQQSTIFSQVMETVETVELDECTLDWNTFFPLLRIFKNMKTIVLYKTRVFTRESLVDRALDTWDTFQKTYDVSCDCDLEDPCALPDGTYRTTAANLGKEYFYAALKNISIYESDEELEANKMSRIVLEILSPLTPSNMDIIELHFGKPTTSMKNVEQQTEFWSALHTIIATKDVKKLVVGSTHKIHTGFSKRFFSFFDVWKQPSNGSLWNLTHLEIDLKPIMLWKSFGSSLVPFLHKMERLEKFTIKMIVLRTDRAKYIKAMCPTNENPYEVHLGLILDDFGGLEAVSEIQQLLISECLYKFYLKFVEVVIFNDGVQRLNQMLPYDAHTQFRHVETFTFSTNLEPRKSFNQFDVQYVIFAFPNLTELRIFDGPSFDYTKTENGKLPSLDEQWDSKSSAVLNDGDIQLILMHLRRLKILILHANLRDVTDSGMTGLPKETCDDLRERDFPKCDIQPEGCCFSSLGMCKFKSLVISKNT